MLPRLHLFEFEDFKWYPNIIREGQTDFLRFLIEFFQVYKAIMPLLAEAVQRTHTQRLVDFCSGGGGAMLIIRQYFKQFPHGKFRAILSDLYPNHHTFKYLLERTQGEITFIEQSVDATQPPADLKGFYTFFNSFHHFRPTQAQQILQNAVQRQAPIGIFEPMEKSVWQIISNTIVLILLPFFVMPFLKPFHYQKLIFTYLIPLIPFCLWWDGMVSVLRLYSPKELIRMAESIDNHTYTWQAGKATHFFGKVTYLIGYPKVTADNAAETHTGNDH